MNLFSILAIYNTIFIQLFGYNCEINLKNIQRERNE
ncbi:hypothetical protein AF80_05555 [Aliarcobacter butzleri L355]|uniref:Uncharacterized protein n=4 Tax=Aliarcobacter butzleri TaxID=28197 RepID=A0A837JCJ7_9BACT|nr:hypothetical protein AF74_07590 [Aliarcobacter butzleri L349]KLD99056.1 hypothetical protein AA20_07495 [Aliarcobacter butzleri L348]KLE00777.1 hypothetical protein AF76_06740 [Aliarcobacter butzleri L351]KLE05403.1 hypothetical protein AF77_04995 [Aliarcobacter butzleri L352]KLE06076.1 hypothetical protein AF78_04065 [Aliarcobacter butzleri L353]KLE09853.1 hypothetical protein AF80_05555 [Aliarcobacter butzleri L355]KLE13700.1 hypothetical protein AF75_02200 [Aliarcobacter butzleri L350]